MVLVTVSAVLLLNNRALPADFGTVPGTGGQSAGAAAAETASGSATTRPTASARSLPSLPATASGRKVPAAPPITATRITATRTPPAARPKAARTTDSPPTASRTAPAADRREVPRQLVLPRFGVRADVLSVTSDLGSLTVPENPRQVGWWVGSALPGSSAGTTVIDGHIDSASAGVGAFIHLSDLVPGDSVSIVGSTGRTLDYDVVARRVYAKNAGLPSSLFAAGGPERLVLISCGGPFDPARGSYEDNIVVFATPSAA